MMSFMSDIGVTVIRLIRATSQVRDGVVNMKFRMTDRNPSAQAARVASLAWTHSIHKISAHSRESSA